MESGIASCTGLSILLAAACRAVGVPSRIAGTPAWAPPKKGNHTWCEVFDTRTQRWHFLGAAEPKKHLDSAWFAGDARKASANNPMHWIYASSFARTPLVFPLVWAQHVRSVHAVNVTSRYTNPPAQPSTAAATENKRSAAAAAATAASTCANDAKQANDEALVKVNIVVYADSSKSSRTACSIKIFRDGSGACIGSTVSHDNSKDVNDMCQVALPAQCSTLRAELTSLSSSPLLVVNRVLKTTSKGEQCVDFVLQQ
jgi:hypothetical protein